MKIDVVEEKENTLFSRKEYTLKGVFEAATPKRDQIADHVANLSKIDKSMVRVKQIKNKYGHKEADMLVYAYTDKAMMDRLEKPEKKKEAEE